MKKLIMLLFVAVLPFVVVGQSKKKKELAGWTATNYEVECMGTGMDGTQLLKVWGYGKKPDEAIIQAKRNAVHAVVFKGIYAGKPGCMKNPLVTEPNAQQKHSEYFDSFFTEGGKYLQFISLSGEGVQDRVKVGKQYKVAIMVSVSHAALRKELEAAGIVKSLGGGF
ncbi:MAG: hypothetical protein ACK5C5_05745 [Bacteroidota bacterium]|jgi:hypothetical protein